MGSLSTAQFVDFNTDFLTDANITTSTSSEAINNSIQNILFTTKGEKVGDPEFGSNIKFLLFEPMDEITIQLLKSNIYDCITKYEPRVKVNYINIVSYEESNFYKLQIIYTIIKTPDIAESYVSVLKRL